MSRIDDALRRLAGGVSPEPRNPNPQTLDRFASEGEIPRVEEPRRVPRVEPRRLGPVVMPGPQPVDDRHAAQHSAAAAASSASDAAASARRAEARPSHHDADPEVEKLIDVRQVVDYVGFVCRSVVRHKLLVAGAFSLALLLTLTLALLMPKTYYVQVKLLAQRNAVMNALTNPGRAVPWDADAPTRAAAETVLRRDNLISLITQTDLINEWDKRRSAVLRFKDWVRQVVTRHQLTADDKLDMLIGMLEEKMNVHAGPIGDGTVTIELFWPDAEMAYRLVERARFTFLEARQAAETTAISESIAILDRYSQSLHNNVNETLTELQRTQAKDSAAAAAAAPRVPRVVRRSPLAAALDPVGFGVTGAESALAPDPDVIRLKSQLSEKQGELTRIEGERQRQLAELQAKLGALQTVYTPSHPSVVTAQQNIAAFQHESPQIVALRTQVEQLEAKYDEAASADADRLVQAQSSNRRATAPRATATAAAPVFDDAPPAVLEPRPSRVTEFASLRLRTELGQLQSILERTDGARIELAVSEAAFKYRYTVITPAEIPRDPAFPNLRLVVGAGLLASILLAIGIALASDIMGNRILEAWQVERQLGLPILGTVRIG